MFEQRNTGLPQQERRNIERKFKIDNQPGQQADEGVKDFGTHNIDQRYWVSIAVEWQIFDYEPVANQRYYRLIGTFFIVHKLWI